ncbi:carbon-nitrogen hydrolase family protein [Marinomonas sp.]|nr:carbon-nitrogen hydrolase family protein [Marinomonas sp.]MDB4837219.1 carbon-nitrogen hydrolase family protein [Marinomonas sp.]
MTNDQYLRVAAAQIAPVWLNRNKTIDKILAAISEAADKDAELVTFGETLLPGYPFWVELTNGAEFNSTRQKEIHAHYLREAVNIEAGHLKPICDIAKQRSIAVIVGVAESASDRGGHSVYCSLVYIDKNGLIKNVHRKLMPTYEERLTWASGDGHGLRTFPVGPFTMGALNCWENWMPLPRAALYGQGENLHVAIWPGGEHNTHDITRFIAKESRSYVISASGLMRAEDFPADTPYLEEILEHAKPMLANGASCIAGPDGEWLVEPQIGKEGIYLATLDFNKVLEERHSFDPVGHYSRPDVTQLHVNRERQSTIKIND